ncbi:hypothetical protein ACFQY7_45720 [Actinomadura luteofluorescens]|uniref:hypothetical protein n=1 Tax=Actinomadura luteofluorescens TaxID=46163 RepID=UPI00363F82DC
MMHAEGMHEEIFLPATYAAGVPYATFAELRAASPVAWVGEPAVGPWPAGPGFWAVFRHADVKHVLRSPDLFSSNLGATQIRDPDTPEDLAFVRAMMLNQDPPDHSRLRRIVAAAFTPAPSAPWRTRSTSGRGPSCPPPSARTPTSSSSPRTSPSGRWPTSWASPSPTAASSTTGRPASSATRTPTTPASPPPTPPR